MKADKKSSYHHGDLRQALLSAAQVELEETGIEGFSLRKVAKRSGVSHAAPAHHFGDTTGLLTALAVLGYETFIKAMEDHRDETAEPLIGAGLGYIAFASENPALFRLIFSSARANYDDPALEKASAAAFGHLAQLIANETGEDPHDSADAMVDALAIWSVAHGLADLLMSGRMKPLQSMPKAARQNVIEQVLSRYRPSKPATGPG